MGLVSNWSSWQEHSFHHLFFYFWWSKVWENLAQTNVFFSSKLYYKAWNLLVSWYALLQGFTVSCSYINWYPLLLSKKGKEYLENARNRTICIIYLWVMFSNSAVMFSNSLSFIANIQRAWSAPINSWISFRLIRKNFNDFIS